MFAIVTLHVGVKNWDFRKLCQIIFNLILALKLSDGEMFAAKQDSEYGAELVLAAALRRQPA